MNNPQSANDIPLDDSETTLTNPLLLPPSNREEIANWLQTISDYESFNDLTVPRDQIVERLIINTERKISDLRDSGHSLEIERKILSEESQLLAKLTAIACDHNHEGRTLQSFDLQTRRLGTALNCLRMYLLENPEPDMCELSQEIAAFSFDQGAFLKELPLGDNLTINIESFVTRSTLREIVLSYGESIIDALNQYPMRITGLYQTPRIPEILIDAALESMRIFFEVDASFPNVTQQRRLQGIGAGIANAMKLQLKTLFARTCEALDADSFISPGIDDLHMETFLASERLLRFSRRVVGGVNPASQSPNEAYEKLFDEIIKVAKDIRTNLGDIPYRPLRPEFSRDLQVLYIELLDPLSPQYQAYTAHTGLVLNPRSFKFNF